MNDGPEEAGREIIGRYPGERLQGDLAAQHHLGFNGALQDALEQMSDEDGWFGSDVRIRLEVTITKNPGAVGEYRAHCTGP